MLTRKKPHIIHVVVYTMTTLFATLQKNQTAKSKVRLQFIPRPLIPEPDLIYLQDAFDYKSALLFWGGGIQAFKCIL